MILGGFAINSDSTDFHCQAVNGINVAGLRHENVLEIIKSSEAEVELLLLSKDPMRMSKLTHFAFYCNKTDL